MSNPEQLTADTMTQAASMSGYDMSVLRWAKKAGCPAFVGSRVRINILKEWIAEHRKELEDNPQISKEQADIKLKLQAYDMRAFNFDVQKKKFFPRPSTVETIRQIAQTQRAVLQRKLESELPPKLLGLGVIEIAAIMRQTVDEVCQIFNDRTKEFLANE